MMHGPTNIKHFYYSETSLYLSTSSVCDYAVYDITHAAITSAAISLPGNRKQFNE